jgi:single-stranded-DNA-specific exonuclease
MNLPALEWELPEPVQVTDALLTLTGGSRIAAELLVRRGLADIEQARRYIDLAAWRPAPPDDLPDMRQAVERLIAAAASHERVGIWGDFDVDGQTATALLVLGLRAIGLEPAYTIPSREEGHGVRPDRLEAFIRAHDLTLIVTCDTGITAHDAVEHARALGVDVIITDHHKLPDVLPDALACVNPQRLRVDHPMRTMAGVTTAFQLLRTLMPAYGLDALPLVDLVALGTIADVALLVDDTRYWVRLGLEQLRQAPRCGLQAVYALAELEAGRIGERDVSFSIGPRLNALGRLGDAKHGVELLITSSEEQAAILANQIEALNTQRRFLTKQVYESAERLLEREPGLLKYGVLILSNSQWAPGVVGIVANKLVERYRRPVFLLRLRPDGLASGSARSIEGIDITALIASHSQVPESYGGHAMAAGVTLRVERIEDFRRALSASLAAVAPTLDAPRLTIDAVAQLSELEPALIRALARIGPFGAGFPAPLFLIKAVTASMQRTFGKLGEHLRFTVEEADGSSAEILWWNGDRDAIPDGPFDLVVEVYESTFRGETRIQLELIALHAADGQVPHTRPTLLLEDLRAESQPDHELQTMLQNVDDYVIWSEHGALAELNSQRLYEIRTAHTLVLWTTPTDRAQLRMLMERVAPDVVIAAAADGVVNADPDSALRTVGGIVRRALDTQDGVIQLQRAAPRAGLSVEAFLTGLRWWEANGTLLVSERESERVKVSRVGGAAQVGHRDHLREVLQAQLEEIAAFQRYFRSTSPESLLALLASQVDG